MKKLRGGKRYYDRLRKTAAAFSIDLEPPQWYDLWDQHFEADRVALALGFAELRLVRKLLAAAPALALVSYDLCLLRRVPVLSASLLALVWGVIWFVVSDFVFLHPTGETVVRALTRVFVW